jgi:hypothetical protein
VLNARRSAGYYFTGSDKFLLYCNKARYTQKGIEGNGENYPTTTAGIYHNKFNANLYPMYLNGGAALDATFGNIGSLLNNRANEFLYANGIINGSPSVLIDLRVAPQKYSVYRNSPMPSIHKIYTDAARLTAASNGGTPPYGLQVITPVGDPDNTVCDQNYNLRLGNTPYIETINTSKLDRDLLLAYHALHADGSQSVATWLAEKQLYTELMQDAKYLAISDTLQAFYQAMQGSNYAAMLDAENAVQQAMADTNNDNLAVLVAQQAIQRITGNAQPIHNLLWVLNLELATKQSPLAPSMQDTLLALAMQCPYEAGDAVYRARSILQKYHTDLRWSDDCAKDAMPAPSNASNTVVVYPNPANSNIIVAYNCSTNGAFSIYNALGEQVYAHTLDAATNKIVLSLPLLPSGVYIYKCTFAACATQVGKLIINQQ